MKNIKGIAKKFIDKKSDMQDDELEFDLSSFGSYINSFESVGSSMDEVYRQDAMKNVSFRKP